MNILYRVALAALAAVSLSVSAQTALTTTAVQTVTGAKSFAQDKLCINGGTSGKICFRTTAVAGTTPFNLGTGGTAATLGANTFTGAQAAPSLALGGATIGTNALAVTGTAALGGTTAITAGTATSAVSAFTVTQAWNYAVAPINGVRFTFTDTSSHANTLPFQILGGAAGATNLLSLGKSGDLIVAGQLTSSNLTVANYVQNNAGAYYARNANANYVFGAADDGSLSRISAGVIGVGTGAAGSFAGTAKATTFIAGSANGATWTHGQASELLTLSTSGTTTDTTADLPADSIIEAVVARVTTTITTATDWKLGDPTTPGRFSAASSTMTAGATVVGTVHVDQTGAAGPRQPTAAKVRVTTTGTPAAGEMRITWFYRKFVAPTS